MNKTDLWQPYCDNLLLCEEVGVMIDTSRIPFPDGFLARVTPALERAFAAMTALEAGAIANPDENRMVGHYWLRAPELAPEAHLTRAIRTTLDRIRTFASAVHAGTIRSEKQQQFRHVLVIGIGGSALGPQLVARALGSSRDAMSVHFFDNTDPDGIDIVLDRLGDHLGQTLTVVVSKSGGTKETRNGMLEAKAAFTRAGLTFAKHAVAVTGEGSELDATARHDGWLDRFPMYDWVGGRTSETSAVGLLPAALQGLDIDAFLEGAKRMDTLTRQPNPTTNPAAKLALAWLHATGGKGEKDMVILPYKDRLELLSRYMQQLIMESLGKELDLQGNKVHQGISVYGNKGSTDQHAYVQQLRDGTPNFFVTFIEVLADRTGPHLEVEPGVTSGDYLTGFLQGTRQALFENGRESITLTLDDVSAFRVGALLALFERTVGLYASLVNINAYHQPGVEAGKKAAADVLDLQKKLMGALTKLPRTVEEIAVTLGTSNREVLYKILEHLASNPHRGVQRQGTRHPREARYCLML